MSTTPDTSPGLHPDQLRIRRAIQIQDETARGSGGDSQLLHDGLVDFDSLFKGSQDRAVTAMNEIGPLMFLGYPQAMLSATWADGFLCALRYARLAAEEAEQ